MKSLRKKRYSGKCVRQIKWVCYNQLLLPYPLLSVARSVPGPRVHSDALPPLNFSVKNFIGMTRYTVLLELIQSQVCMSERGFHSSNWVLYSVSSSIFGG